MRGKKKDKHDHSAAWALVKELPAIVQGVQSDDQALQLQSVQQLRKISCISALLLTRLDSSSCVVNSSSAAN